MSFFRNYFELIEKKIKTVDVKMLNQAVKMITLTNEQGGKVIIAGNGGSASISSHFAIDLTKNTRIKCITFNEPNLITCFANDYGYEKWIEKGIEYYADPEDLVILISSSGSSKNIINAAKYIKKIGLKLITFSGFGYNNPLKEKGDINLWIDSKAYNIVEMTHYIWLLAIVDKISKDNKQPS